MVCEENSYNITSNKLRIYIYLVDRKFDKIFRLDTICIRGHVKPPKILIGD